MSAQEAHKIADNYQKLIESAEGKVAKREYWGLRSLSYIVKKNKKGHYIFFVIACLPGVMNKIENDFKVSEDIIKFLTIKVNKVNESETELAVKNPVEIKN